MSYSTIAIVMNRIKSATKDSPIAIFAGPISCHNKFEAVFGAIQATKDRAEGDPLFIGMFDMSMSKNKVLEKIDHALRDIAA